MLVYAQLCDEFCKDAYATCIVKGATLCTGAMEQAKELSYRIFSNNGVRLDKISFVEFIFAVDPATHLTHKNFKLWVRSLFALTKGDDFSCKQINNKAHPVCKATTFEVNPAMRKLLVRFLLSRFFFFFYYCLLFCHFILLNPLFLFACS